MLCFRIQCHNKKNLKLHCITEIYSFSSLHMSVSIIITPCVCSPPPQADYQVETMRQHFQEESLDYVCKLQEIQERKKFECVEPVSDSP